jgi:hypothetical protein
LIPSAGISNISGAQLMNIANIAAVENLEEVDQRFKRWRSSRRRGTPIPEDLWASAVGLARAQGLNRTAQALRLDYYDLKKRLQCAEGGACARQAPPTFLEWRTPAAIGSCECRLELQNARGAKMRIELKGGDLAGSLASLSSAFWSAP